MAKSSIWSSEWTDSRIDALRLRRPTFVFDLDSTITKCELLPLIAEKTGMSSEMSRLTENAMRGMTPFREDFPARVALLKDVPVSEAREIAAGAPLNEAIARFIRQNSQRCRILTGNLDAWIEGLIAGLNMSGCCMCSAAEVLNDRIERVSSVMDKTSACREISGPFIAIGDGDNDIGMLKAADIGIAFGGVRRLTDAVRQAADIEMEDENALVGFLERFL